MSPSNIKPGMGKHTDTRPTHDRILDEDINRHTFRTLATLQTQFQHEQDTKQTLGVPSQTALPGISRHWHSNDPSASSLRGHVWACALVCCFWQGKTFAPACRLELYVAVDVLCSGAEHVFVCVCVHVGLCVSVCLSLFVSL